MGVPKRLISVAFENFLGCEFYLAAESKLSAPNPVFRPSRPGLHPERAEPPLTQENRSWNSQTWDSVKIKPKLHLRRVDSCNG
jgi:hypothetical protein